MMMGFRAWELLPRFVQGFGPADMLCSESCMVCKDACIYVVLALLVLLHMAARSA